MRAKWVRTLNVVVVDVELGSLLDAAGGPEGCLDVALTEGVVERRSAESSILIERLIDDIPGVDAATELGHDCNQDKSIVHE